MTTGRAHVLIAGAAVAGLEAVLALRATLGDHVDITIVSPEPRFVNRSTALIEPSKPQRRHGLALQDVASDLAARWHRGSVRSVDAERRMVVTADGMELAYDKLILAVGARFARPTRAKGVLTYHGRRDGPAYRLLLRQLREGRVTKLAFIKPSGATWPLPLYDLALATAAECRIHGRPVELSLITPEVEPLEMFGGSAGAAIRVPGLDDVYAAGDATTLPIKQGGLAAQQADAVAEAIAASLGAVIDPRPLQPILRGLLLTGDAAHYLRADLDGSRTESTVSEVALWWPPNRLCGRYLAPISAARLASPPT
jgi:sulfide:quinone oxidoreductase